eukprot:gene5816-11736_t
MEEITTRKRIVGVDITASRRNREEQIIQIRKDKRMDRTSMQRLKVTEEQSLLPKYQKGKPRKNLELLPIKKELLFRDDIDSQIEGATYFRKVLSVDKFPPIDIIIESGVVPRLIEFLAYNHCLKLQFECTWAITNIACGDSHHTKTVINAGAVPFLLDIIRSGADNVREQALWALGNISGDSTESRLLLLNLGILEPLLWQLGIGQSVTLKVDSPSLTTMRHVAWTCSNLTRGKPDLSEDNVRLLIFALMDLLQSPDDELIKDVCTSLLNIFEINHSVYIQITLEHGILTRLCEICDIGLPAMNSACVVNRSAAIRLLCAIVSNGDLLQRNILLLKRFKLFSHCLVELSLSEENNVSETL